VSLRTYYGDCHYQKKIEIKRDVEDIKQRREAFEFQAIRYAASYAKIKTTDELVDKIFTSYIEKYKDEFELGELTAYEC
jgi:hypothetical protein